tara:strand:+ start:2356 stop:6861 length:4506 start_codon:yes stop_codon:yes gene_type:complete
MAQDPFDRQEFQRKLDAIARQTTGDQFRLNTKDPQASEKFGSFLADEQESFGQQNQPEARPDIGSFFGSGIIENLGRGATGIGRYLQENSPLTREGGFTGGEGAVGGITQALSGLSPFAAAGSPGQEPFIPETFVGDSTGLERGVREGIRNASHPLELLITGTTAGVGSGAAAALRAGGSSTARKVAAKLIEPVAGGFGRRAGFEGGAGLGANIGGSVVQETLPENTSTPVRLAATLAGGLVGGGVGAVGGLKAVDAGARISPIGTADAAFDGVDAGRRAVGDVPVGEKATVFDPAGNPVEVTVSGRSEAGSIEVTLPDGQKKILEIDELAGKSVNDADYVIGTTGKWADRTVSDLTDVELEEAAARIDEIVQSRFDAGQPDWNGLRDRNAVKLEQRKRATPQASTTLPTSTAAARGAGVAGETARTTPRSRTEVTIDGQTRVFEDGAEVVETTATPVARQAPAAARQVTPQQQAIIDDVGTGALPADDVAVDALDAAPVGSGVFDEAGNELTPTTAGRAVDDVGGVPADVQIDPLPGGLTDLTDFAEQFGITFREGTFGFKIPLTGKNITLPKLTPRKVGEFLRLGAADPSLRAKRTGTQLGHVLNPLNDEGVNLTARAFSYVDEVGTREGLFGRLDETGRFSEDKAGVLKGLSLNDAERPEILRQLNPTQRIWVDRLRQIQAAARDLRNRAGGDVGKMTETEKLLFFGRGIAAKRNKAGEIIAIREIADTGSGRKLGGKISSEKGRVVETMEELTEQGFDVVPFDQRVRDQLRAAYKANAQDSLVKYMKENFDLVPGDSTFEGATKLPLQNHNLLIRGREGQQIATDLADEIARQAEQADVVFRGVAKFNSVSRYFALAGDASFSTIQLIIAAFGHKKAYIKALGAFADALAKGIVNPEMAARSNAARLQRAIPLANRHGTLKLGGGEFTEAFNPEGVLGATDLWNEALSIRGALQRAKAMPRRLLEPFRIATEAAFDEAGLSMAEGLEHLAKNADGTFDAAKLQDLDDHINNIRGLTSSSRIGVNQASRTRESAVLLASQYRRATAALYSSMLQGGIKGELARKAMFKMVTGMMMLGTGITILVGIENGDSAEDISKDVKERMNPLHPRFMLWEVAGQLVGPGSKILSDMRLLKKMATDPEGFMDTKEFASNNFVSWVRGQLAFAPGLPINMLLGKDAGGNPIGEGGIGDLGRDVFTGNFIPLTANAVFFSGGPNDTGKGKIARGVADFFGGRSFPAGAFDHMNKGSELTWGVPYGDTEPYQKTITRRQQAEFIDPITAERAATGDKLSTYFVKTKEIDDLRLQQEKNIIDGLAGTGPLAGIVTKKPFAKAPLRSALDLYYEAQSNARNQKVGVAAGAGIDFNEQKETETDANIDALEAYNLTFDNAIVGDFFMSDVWNKLVDSLLKSLPVEQSEYVIRNTNRGVHADGILELLKGTGTRKRIDQSEAARQAHSGIPVASAIAPPVALETLTPLPDSPTRANDIIKQRVIGGDPRFDN